VTWLCEGNSEEKPGRSSGARRDRANGRCGRAARSLQSALPWPRLRRCRSSRPGSRDTGRCLVSVSARRSEQTGEEAAFELPPRRQTKRTNLQHPIAVRRRMLSEAHNLCRRSAERQAPERDGADRRRNSRGAAPALRRAHHEGGPAATGCQRVAHEERSGCRAGTPGDRQTCPRERVLRSFP
jgi:hypothetical protein